MSEQYKFLARAARYLSKLQVLGLLEVDDPFAAWNNSKFEDMCLCPPIEYLHIFCAESCYTYSLLAFTHVQLRLEWLYIFKYLLLTAYVILPMQVMDGCGKLHGSCTLVPL